MGFFKRKSETQRNEYIKSKAKRLEERNVARSTLEKAKSRKYEIQQSAQKRAKSKYQTFFNTVREIKGEKMSSPVRRRVKVRPKKKTRKKPTYRYVTKPKKKKISGSPFAPEKWN